MSFCTSSDSSSSLLNFLKTMAWIEISLATSPEHETLIDAVHDVFFDAPRAGPWTPHLSLAYDNFDAGSTPLNAMAAYHVVGAFPSLLSVPSRKVTALQLWSTYGTLDRWKCIDVIPLLP
jgi:hypothetical protein